MKKLLGILIAIALFLPIASGRQTKTITLQWDPMPDTEHWTEIRVYDISASPVMMTSTACQPGPPIVCPTQVTITVQRRAYSFVARSYDSVWESDDSNVAVQPGPPKPPNNLKK